VEQQSAEIASWQAAIQPQKSTGELLETNSCGISSDAFFPEFFLSPNP
jgi:AICAR transformylase/IMP cyclohydrolase PurH